MGVATLIIIFDLMMVALLILAPELPPSSALWATKETHNFNGEKKKCKELNMESQYKVSDGVIESGAKEKQEAVANKRTMRGCELVLRVVAVALSLAAAVVLATNKQTVTVAVILVPTLPAVNIPVTAKWHDLSSSVYFFVANIIACTYGVISLLLMLANKGTKKGVAMLVIIFDLVMVALLFSSVGASSALGLMGYKGNSHLQWRKVCNVFGKFCLQGTAALALCGVASFAFFLLVLLAILNLHKKC
ncbi:hypothetical protein BUALT_Bualt12G0124100 [Buddleja alternifolia]|uniref:CASP-like protein n=1 Tax=Buddleja alternifolia TaxID=168488 RepID=A0AAV6WX01_9LAMI|nr:hypothetical protein BUALT_Bualt12G0124100 [Buddleja alternifolia]